MTFYPLEPKVTVISPNFFWADNPWTIVKVSQRGQTEGNYNNWVGFFDNEIISAIRQREADITKERVEKILASGANVILTTGGIDDLNTKYFVERGAMGVRRVLKKDMKRIAKACGGKSITLRLYQK